MRSSNCSQIGTGSSNSPRSTIQSFSFRTCRRIARIRAYTCDFAIARGPENVSFRAKRQNPAKPNPGEILPRSAPMDKANSRVQAAAESARAISPDHRLHTFCLQRTGESRFMPDSPVSASILSVRSKTGSLRRLNTLWWGFAHESDRPRVPSAACRPALDRLAGSF
jgi:hypothetical protein